MIIVKLAEKIKECTPPHVFALRSGAPLWAWRKGIVP